ncbi:MAG TPA: helix-turn-helix domain-containing protein [Thermoplasmata archaeon]|nr:helix-turn-helix domain-containing protein [Thermoplasmata archaeon]HUJ78472.1 helix-turn-helix domain-containing protein [Thermoplasmata archaeon]
MTSTSQPSPPGGGAVPPEHPKVPGNGSEAPGDALTTALLHFGLGLREAQLYRTLLKFGPLSARQSIGLAGLDRATGYRVLSKLRARGLVNSTPTRPQRFVPLDIGRLFERTVNVVRDDLELLRILREHYVAEGSRVGGRDGRAPSAPAAPTFQAPGAKPRWPSVRVFPRGDDIVAAILQMVDSAKEEVDALVMPPMIPEGSRAPIARAIANAVDRGVRVRLVVDYRPLDLEFLALILKSWGSVAPGFEFRFYAPHLCRLYLVDHRAALRCIRSGSSPAAGPDLGVGSDDLEFVRFQATRFQSVWREALPMQRGEPGLSGGRGGHALDNPRTLRRWVERGAIVTGRVAATELAALFGLTPPAPRRMG